MGFDAKSSLVIGISMAKLFKDFKEISDTFDEYDKYGNKTGKQFKEEKFIGVLPNGLEVIISEKKINNTWRYDWYNSIGFDGDIYIGDMLNITVNIHYGDHETNDLHQIIIGLEVCETDWINNGSKHVAKVDEDVTNIAIDRTRKQLAELFGYTGELNLYLLNILSY